MKRQHCAAVEFRKERHLKIYLVPLAFLILLFFWCAFSFRNADAYDLAQGYTYLLFQIPMLNCILMPVMLAVIASRLCDMEIKGGTLKLLYTVQSKHGFYDWKYLHSFFYLLLFSIGEGLAIPFCGKIFGFTEALPAALLLRHVGILLLVGAVVLTVQHFLSLMSANQIIPLLVGLMGSFLGLFSMYFPPAAARLVLWGYFGAFLPFGMDWDKDTRILSFYQVPFPTTIFVLFLVFGILLYLFCRAVFLKKEV